MKRFLWVLAILGLFPGFWGCSESERAPQVDTSAPQVRLLYPPNEAIQPFVVSDSIDVYVGAKDTGVDSADGALAKVEFWFTRPNNPNRERIGVVTAPLAAIPDSAVPLIQLPEGWKLYTRRWYTGPKYPAPVGTPINSGTFIQLFAIAVDQNGNQGNTDQTRVRILNLGEDLRAPYPDFIVTPSSGGTTRTDYTFDPSLTVDSLDADNLVQVRWDFNGDPSDGWNIDWSDNVHADEVQHWQFSAARVWTVILEARNSYLPDSTRDTSRTVTVLNPGGAPHPPELANFVEIPTGIYTLGSTSYVLDDSTFAADAIEAPVHQVALTQSFLIEKTEVTNLLYLNYILSASHPDTPLVKRVVYQDGRILSAADGTRYLELSESKIFYDLDARTFRVREGYDEHPVTGVSWFGAYNFALYYGCRLPSEAEWEVAARGTHSEYNYPFGERLLTSDGGRRANYRGSGDPFELPQPGTTPRRFYDGLHIYNGSDMTIDSPSVFGLYDMAGNVAEWVSDWLGPYNPGTATDPQGPVSGEFRVVRGGSFESSRVEVRCTARRGAKPPDVSFPSIGFRLAYSPIER